LDIDVESGVQLPIDIFVFIVIIIGIIERP
jgi:hypothetical protein